MLAAAVSRWSGRIIVPARFSSSMLCMGCPFECLQFVERLQFAGRADLA
jgi:hypothetical protein